LTNNGEDELKQHSDLATNLPEIKQQEQNFEKFYFISMVSALSGTLLSVFCAGLLININLCVTPCHHPKPTRTFVDRIHFLWREQKWTLLIHQIQAKATKNVSLIPTGSVLRTVHKIWCRFSPKTGDLLTHHVSVLVCALQVSFWHSQINGATL